MMNELATVTTKYFEIGTQLAVGEDKLKEFEHNHPLNATRRFSEVIIFWLRGNTVIPVNWESIAKVLETPIVGEKQLAKDIREKYLTTTSQGMKL